jgi:hypothetical protein
MSLRVEEVLSRGCACIFVDGLSQVNTSVGRMRFAQILFAECPARAEATCGKLFPPESESRNAGKIILVVCGLRLTILGRNVPFSEQSDFASQARCEQRPT